MLVMPNILVSLLLHYFFKVLFVHLLMMKLFALNAKPNIQLLIIIVIC